MKRLTLGARDEEPGNCATAETESLENVRASHRYRLAFPFA